MSRLVQTGKLVSRSQRRCDKENDPSIAGDEWKELVSEAWGELYEAVAETGLRHFESTQAINANGAASYALPADHLSTIGVDLVAADGTRTQLRELMVQERNRYAGKTGTASYWSEAGSNLILYPKPAAGSYELLYIPQAADISGNLDATTVDVVCAAGERFVIWAVAVKAGFKSQEQLADAVRERDQALAAAVNWATKRALNSARRIVVDDDPCDDGYEEGDFG